MNEDGGVQAAQNQEAEHERVMTELVPFYVPLDLKMRLRSRLEKMGEEAFRAWMKQPHLGLGNQNVEHAILRQRFLAIELLMGREGA